MQREAVAANVFGWLRPGGWLALVWGGSPWDGDQAWQAALRAFMARWQERVAARSGDRIPAGYEQARQTRPDLEILRAAGFEIAPAEDLPARARVVARLHRGLPGQHVGALGGGAG